ncbi:MAG TPA: HEAT repeat domain-containing protein [Gemmatimonadaceae bacterium]|jgi:HEAT repeat protein
MAQPPAAPPASSRAPVDPLGSVISEALKSLARAVRSFQLYLPNNPMHVRALDSARAALVALWARTDHVEIGVTETEFTHEDISIYSETDRGGESLPWMFYKDGIRSFEMRKGFETRDLPRFLGALQAVRAQAGGDEDLVTLFWECDFEFFSYKYEEAGGDGYAAPGAELLRGGAPAGVIEAPGDTESDVGTYGSSPSQFARISDFDSTLYFLEEQEIAYLHDSIRQDFSGDLRPSVAAALLDTFETETDPTVREEVCAILENFMLVLLSGLQFRATAFLIRESAAATSRAENLLPSHRQRLTELVNRISDPATLNQLLDVLEDTSLKPPQQDLVTLFTRLNSAALQPLVSHLVRSRNGELRALLEEAVTRLASSNTLELMELIGSDDEAVSLEAMRRAGDLKSPAAVAHLARALESSSDTSRAAAIAALAQIGSPGAMQVLERGLEDEDRDIRLAVVKACAERQYRPIMGRLERTIKDRLVREGSSAEKTAYFDAYATLGGDSAIALLESILIPRGILARKEDPITRASAAMALGKLASERALDVLRKAAGDKEIVVRSAAARALRGAG